MIGTYKESAMQKSRMLFVAVMIAILAVGVSSPRNNEAAAEPSGNRIVELR